MSGKLSLKFKVVKCTGLKRLDAPGKKPDSYVIVEIEDSAFSTTAKERSSDPMFNEAFAAEVSHSFLKRGLIVLRVCHLLGGDAGAVLLGENTITFAKATDGEQNIVLLGQDGKTPVGSVTITIEKKQIIAQSVSVESESVVATRAHAIKKARTTASTGSPKAGSPKMKTGFQSTAPKKLVSPSTKITKSPASPSPPPIGKKPTLSQVVPSPAQTKRPVSATPAKTAAVSKAKAKKPEKKKSGGVIGLVGGIIGLLKLPIMLGGVTAASLIGISYIPEEKCDNELTQFSKKFRKNASEKSQEWYEKSKGWVKNAGSASKVQAERLGGSVQSVGGSVGKRVTGWNPTTGFMGKKVVVQPGDTLSKIAIENNTTVTRLRRINGLADEDVVSAGSCIKV